MSRVMRFGKLEKREFTLILPLRDALKELELMNNAWESRLTKAYFLNVLFMLILENKTFLTSTVSDQEKLDIILARMTILVSAMEHHRTIELLHSGTDASKFIKVAHTISDVLASAMEMISANVLVPSDVKTFLITDWYNDDPAITVGW